jgi:diguanylate cyclase (GGDEF)-like protein/PAS domain S-box-containing protein
VSDDSGAPVQADAGAARPVTRERGEPGATCATTVVRADPALPEPQAVALHPQLLAHLRELRLRTGSSTLDPSLLLQLVSSHYAAVDEERRGIVRAMQLMADEARALAHEAHEESTDHLQVILDTIKESVLAVDEEGLIQSFNPTGERIFGYIESEVVGQRLDLIMPQIVDRGTVSQGLERLAASIGDTHLDLAPYEIWGRRKSGEVFPAEITVSRARVRGRERFLVCLRDVTERRAAEVALRESEARYRMLVDHAPEAILVLDADTGRFVDGNANAERLFGVTRAELLELGPFDVSPRLQPDGSTSVELGKALVERALAGEPQLFEWMARDAAGRHFVCEMRLLRLPSTGRRLVRGSLTDISERKWAERFRAAERDVLQTLATDGDLRTVLESVTRLIESVGVGEACSLSLLASDGEGFCSVVAPRLSDSLRSALARATVGIGSGSCAAAVYLGREVAVADIGKDPFWHKLRDPALDSGLRAAWSRPIRAADGKVLGALGVFRAEAGLPGERESQTIAHATQLAGIALERLHAAEALRNSEVQAHVTLQSIGDAVIRTNANGLIEYLNPVAEKLTGWRADEARGRPIGKVLALLDEATREPLADPVERLLAPRPAALSSDHPVLVTRSREEVAIQESAAPIRDRDGGVIGAVFVFHDVTKERRLRRALSYQASHDALTGLINRREFDNRLQAAAASARSGANRFALLYVDLDQFKVVNDTCGHQAGDRLMRDITGLLQTRVRAADTIARLGGDEFGILLDGCTLEQAARIADGIRQAIHGHRFTWGAITLSVGASIGVVEITQDTGNVANVMSAADIACYAAKEEGRNRVHVYDAEGQGVSNRHREMHWVARVTRAAEQDRLELYFQPIVAIASRVPAAFHELTVRLRDDTGDIVPPTEFIPAAERYNVMPLIDRWVVLRAIELVRARRGNAPLLAVNLSGTSLNDQSFLEFVLQHTYDPAIARSLCFEITETAAVTNLSNALYFMRELKGRGCRFSLDDFGSGLSSFMYLKTLPVDFLKIDGQFISHVAASPVDRSMVEAISKVGRALGIATVAECVETQDVLAELERIGVDFVQGFYLARPRPIAELGR